MYTERGFAQAGRNAKQGVGERFEHFENTWTLFMDSGQLNSPYVNESADKLK